MSNITPRLGLIKPLQGEQYDIDIVNANSDVVDLALDNILTGWVDYTPTVLGTTTNPTNLTVDGRYKQVGKLVVGSFSIRYVAGSTPGSGGSWKITLPVAVSGSMEVFTSSCELSPNGASTYQGTAEVSTFYGPNHMSIVGPSTATSNVIAAVGNGGIAGTAWTNGGYIRGSFVYEAA